MHQTFNEWQNFFIILICVHLCSGRKWSIVSHSWALPTSCPTLHILPVLQLMCDAVVSWITSYYCQFTTHLEESHLLVNGTKSQQQTDSTHWNELIYQATSACVVLVSVVLFCAVAEVLHRAYTINILYNHQWRLRISNNAFWCLQSCFLSHIHLNKNIPTA